MHSSAGFDANQPQRVQLNDYKILQTVRKIATPQRFTHPKRYNSQLPSTNMLYYNDSQPDELEEWQHHMKEVPGEQEPVDHVQWLLHPSV